MNTSTVINEIELDKDFRTDRIRLYVQARSYLFDGQHFVNKTVDFNNGGNFISVLNVQL